MIIQSPAPEIHRIVERFIATVTVDEKQWDCFGTIDKTTGPAVIQCSPMGLDMDFTYDLSDSRNADIQAACERLWLDGAFVNSEFLRSLNKG